MCNSRKYPYLRHRMVFLRPPPTPQPVWKVQLSFIHSLKFFGLTEPPNPPGNSNPFCGGGGVWIFSETEQYISSALYPTVHNDN